MTQRIKLFFFETWLTELNHFSNMTQRNWTYLFNMTLTNIWLKELNFFPWLKDFVEYDTKNRTFFLNMTKESIFFFWKYVLRTFSVWFTELNFFPALLKEWNIWEDDSKHWTFCFTWPKELNVFSNMTQRVEPFCKIWRKIFWTFFLHDSQNWTILKHESQNWTFVFFFEKHDSQRLNNSFQHESKEMTPFFEMTQRVFVFHKIHDSKNNDPFFCEIMTQRIDFLKKNKILRIELFFKKIWL